MGSSSSLVTPAHLQKIAEPFSLSGPKKSNQKMTLGNFLSDQSLGSWADEMEDMPVAPNSEKTGYERRGFASMAGPGGARDGEGNRYSIREEQPLPTKPPFTAHLGNLSFDVTAADVEDFFAECEVTNVRIVEDRFDRKPKGFGYVEFNTLEGLKKALTLHESSFQGRKIRISVAEPPKERQEGRELNDWTRKGPLPDLPQQQNRRASDRVPTRSFESGSDAGSDRGGSRRGPPPFEGDGKFRDFNNWERRGPPAPLNAVQQPPPSRDGSNAGGGGSMRGSQRSFERRPSPAWGEGRSQEGSRPPRPAPPERAPTAAEQDTQWRARMKPDAPPSSTPTPDASTPSSPSASAAPAPTTRPRLNLQKRTVSDAPPADQPASAGDSKSSPFGAAKPIDTATREQQIADKREAVRKQKEVEDKAREEKNKAEKAAAAAAAKADKASREGTPKSSSNAPENGKSGESKSKKQADSGEKENGATPQAPGRQYEILRRVAGSEDGGSAADAEEVEAADGDAVPANGEIVDDKSVKPKEIVRDRSTVDQQQQSGGQEASAESLEGDGWSTVPSGQKGRGKHGRAASRAIAS